MVQYDINLRDYSRILKKRKLTVLFTAVILGAFSTALAILTAPTPLYTSVCSVKFQKETTVEGLYPKTMWWSGSDDIETQMTIIKSYPIMLKAAEKLKLIPNKAATDDSLSDPEIASVVDDLLSKVEVSREEYTNIMHIEVTDKDRDLAQRLADAIAIAYKEVHAEDQNKRTAEALKYIAAQLKAVQKKHREAEDEFNRFTRKNRLVSFDLQSENLLKRANKIRSEIRRLGETRSELDGLIVKLEGFLKDPSGSGHNFYSTSANGQFQDANDTLVGLLLKRDSLLKDYTPKHPEVVALSRKIIETARKMELLVRLQINSIAKKKIDLGKSLKEAGSKTTALMEKKVEYDRLKRKVDSYNNMTALLERKNQEALIRQAEKPDEITVVRPALLPVSPTNPPRTAAKGGIGIIIGLVLGIVIALILETFDTSLAAISDVEETLGSQVLGVIPHWDIKSLRQHQQDKEGETPASRYREQLELISHFGPQTMVAEGFRGLRTNIHFRELDKKIKTLSITSTSPQEGKTTVATNLAIAIAQSGAKTLLMECDFRKPIISRIFGLQKTPGLTDVLLGNYPWRDVLRTITDIMMGKMEMDEVMMTPGLDNLSVMPSGTIPPNPAELTESKRLSDLLEELKKEYDIVILDTPPILSTTEPVILGRKVDAVLLVYRVGSIARALLKRAADQLSQVKCNLLGVVLNDLKAEVSPDFQDFKYYKAYYSYGESKKRKSGKIFKRQKPGKLGLFIMLVAVAFLLGGIIWQIASPVPSRQSLHPETMNKLKKSISRPISQTSRR